MVRGRKAKIEPDEKLPYTTKDYFRLGDGAKNGTYLEPNRNSTLKTAFFPGSETNHEKSDEFHVKVAKTTQEACKLVKVGFEYVTGEYHDGGKIFRKRKYKICYLQEKIEP